MRSIRPRWRLLRFLRNGIVTGVVLNLANAYMFYAALTGHGLF